MLTHLVCVCVLAALPGLTSGACSSGYSSAALTWSNMGQGWHLGNPDKTADQVKDIMLDSDTNLVTDETTHIFSNSEMKDVVVKFDTKATGVSTHVQVAFVKNYTVASTGSYVSQTATAGPDASQIQITPLEEVRIQNLDVSFCKDDSAPCNAPHPCQHGGTCQTTTASYTCQCVTPYTGTNCETCTSTAHEEAEIASIYTTGRADGADSSDPPEELIYDSQDTLQNIVWDNSGVSVTIFLKNAVRIKNIKMDIRMANTIEVFYDNNPTAVGTYTSTTAAWENNKEMIAAANKPSTNKVSKITISFSGAAGYARKLKIFRKC